MTEIEDEEFEPDSHCKGHPVQPRKWRMAWLGAMLFNLFANVSRSFVEFCEEACAGFYAHGLWKQNEQVRVVTAKQFQDSVMQDINAL